MIVDLLAICGYSSGIPYIADPSDADLTFMLDVLRRK